MLRSWLAVALRNLRTQKLYSAINIVGLAVGLACFVLIGLFVRYELGYDSRWADSERIYRISRDYFQSAETTEAHPAGMAGAAAPLLEQDFPQIEAAARIFCCGGVARTPDGEPHLEGGYADADNALFEIFDFEWISGDPATALTRPTDMVLTRSAARRHFGDADPIGRTLLVGGNDWLTFVVVGVIEDLPEDTHLDFDLLGSMLNWTTDEGALQYLNDWGNDVFYTYVKLREGADVEEIRSRSGEFFERHVREGASAYNGFTVTPVTDIHLRSNREDELWMPAETRIAGNMSTVYGAIAIAVFILMLACINFTNLCTARSAHRAKEVGVRKAVGAGRFGLSLQFLIESVLMTAIAALAAMALVELALPSFSGFLLQSLAHDYLGDPTTLAALALLVLATAAAAGAYPALYLSGYRPVRVLKGDTTREGGGALRKGLVVFQFAISIVLLISTALVYQQMQYARGIELGFDKERIVVVSPGGGRAASEWLAHPEITHVTTSDLVPFEQSSRTAEIGSEGSPGGARRMPFLNVDYGFFETYGIEIVAGRAFSEEFGADRPSAELGPDGRVTQSFVISELAARELGWTPQEAVGKWLELGDVQGFRFFIPDAEGPVVGVVADIYFEGARKAVQPLVYTAGGGSRASLKLTGRSLDETLEFIDRKWKEMNTLIPINRRFLEQDFEALYTAEDRQARMLTFFSGLAVLIACLGLFGLASFATERRTKEIGVRKAIGGTTADIVALFTSEFATLVAVANLIAWPIAYFLIRRWLDGFAYRIDIGLGAFAAGGALALAVAMVTVGATAARAASARPVHSLRYE